MRQRRKVSLRENLRVSQRPALRVRAISSDSGPGCSPVGETVEGRGPSCVTAHGVELAMGDSRFFSFRLNELGPICATNQPTDLLLFVRAKQNSVKFSSPRTVLKLCKNNGLYETGTHTKVQLPWCKWPLRNARVFKTPFGLKNRGVS